MAEQVVLMVLEPPGAPGEEARERLADVLQDATVGPPDEAGVFEVRLDADTREDALHRVWNAVAASGADDHVLFVEHPDIPEHWKTKEV